jgi:DNA-directed RNA polymerase subunit RPC12/RpoP
MIRCYWCGYRIIMKERTKNYITYETEWSVWNRVSFCN